LTLIVRPFRFFPFRLEIAASASALFGISTNPKPLDYPGPQEIRKDLPGIEKTLLADVALSRDVEAAFAELNNHWGGLDVLINNAGISIRHRFLDIEDKD